jgi:ribose-phosphate pyrophosphokinase
LERAQPPNAKDNPKRGESRARRGEGVVPQSCTLLAGTANLPLADAVATALGARLGRRVLERFPDGEVHVEVQDSVRGHDVYLLQSTSPPAEAHLIELLFLADACRRAGAAQITAIMPYFGYARQDRRASGREAVPARLVADLLATSGLQRVVAVDFHNSGLEAVFSLPLEHLSAVPLLVEAVRRRVPPNGVIVAPDFGAARLAERYSALLDLPVAIVHKTRLSGDAVRAGDMTGDVRDRVPLVVDDMLGTAGTVQAAAEAVVAAGGVPETSVIASHALLVGAAVERLRQMPVRRLVVTDSVAQPASLALPLQIVTLAPLLAEAIVRLHEDRSLSDLIVHQ